MRGREIISFVSLENFPRSARLDIIEIIKKNRKKSGKIAIYTSSSSLHSRYVKGR